MIPTDGLLPWDWSIVDWFQSRNRETYDSNSVVNLQPKVLT